MAWLQLIRWRNLLIIMLTQLVAWWYVVMPTVPVVLDAANFWRLCLSTVLIAAAGYIINDYFDIKIDAINRPHKVVLERAIPRKQAIVAHAVLNVIALLLAGKVAMGAHHPEWLTLQLLCITLLWFYSTHFKRQYITGNVVVALLTALTIVALIVYEPVMHRAATQPLRAHSFDGSSLPVWVLGVYAYFAFMLTWMREIVKDMEDYKGDEAEGCETLPVRRGLRYATRFTLALAAFVVLTLCVAVALLYMHGYLLLAPYIVLLLVAPLLLWAAALGRKASVRHYHAASRNLKLIMLSGVFSLVIYFLEQYEHFSKQ